MMTSLRARFAEKPKDEVLYLPVLCLALDRGGEYWKRPRINLWRKPGSGVIFRVGWRWTAVVVSVGGLMRLEKTPGGVAAQDEQ